MQNEDTRLANETAPEKAQEQKKEVKNMSTLGAAAAGAAGGFVAGAAAGAAASAAAAPALEVVEENIEETAEETPEVNEAEVLLVNDEGVRVAHVEANSFSEAFAQARQQVGPGGIFEYNGQIYGTYYADEWNAMSAQERADYQARVSGVAPTHHDHHAQTSSPGHAEVAPDAEMISVEPVDNEIHVLGVETVESESGALRTMATIEVGGEVGLMVDVDNDGRMDVLFVDDNGDGRVQDYELMDISEANIHVAELEHLQAAQAGDLLYASADDMPDYINDADSIMTV